MKLLYIKRNAFGSEVKYIDDSVVLSKVPLSVINMLCVQFGSTYQGRIESVRASYGINKMIPVYVNEDILLFPNGPVRDYETIWINYHQISAVNDGKIMLKNGELLLSNAKITNRQLKKCFEIAF